MNTPSDANALWRIDGQFLLPFFGRSGKNECAFVVRMFGMMKEMRHEVLAYRGNEIAGLIVVLIFSLFWWHVRRFAYVDKVAYVQLELQRHVSI